MGCDVVLVHTPFFRLFGSHNNRAPIGLCYLARYLEMNDLDVVVINGDYTQGSRLWRWRKLFDETENFKMAVDGRSAIYGELIEWIMSYDPKVVIIGAGDSLCPTVDLGNGYVGTQLSMRLRELGVFTIGYGPFYSVDRRFDYCFDSVIVGLPTDLVVPLARKKIRAVVKGRFKPVLPALEKVVPAGCRDDVVFTKLGCPHRCSFCWVQLIQTMDFFPTDVVIKDVMTRESERIYFADNIFPLTIWQLRQIRDGLKEVGCTKKFSCEARVNLVDATRIGLMRNIGVDTVKIGVEVFDDEMLNRMNKDQTESQISNAVELLKKCDFKVIAYVMLGGAEVPERAYEKTLDFLEKAEFDYVVVNVCAYDDWVKRDYRYDAHFSMECVRRWGVQKMLPKFFALQEAKQNPSVEGFI